MFGERNEEKDLVIEIYQKNADRTTKVKEQIAYEENNRIGGSNSLR